MGPAINNLLNSIDKAVGERDKNVVKFCAQLQKDIAELYKDMKLIKQEAQVNSTKSKFSLLHSTSPSSCIRGVVANYLASQANEPGINSHLHQKDS